MSKALRQTIDHNLARLGRLRATLMFAFGGLLMLAAAQPLWSAWQTFAGSDGGAVLAERDRLATEFEKRGRELRNQFLEALGNPELRADLDAGAYADAATKLRANWPALVDAAAFQGNLDDAYATGPEQIGFGRMATLSAALVSADPVLGLAGKRDGLHLAIATVLRDAGKPVAVVYGEFALDSFTSLVEQARVDGGLLEMRAGQQTVFSKGSESLRQFVVPVPAKDTPFMLAAAASPDSAGGTPFWQRLGLGVVLLLLGGGCLAFARGGGGAAPQAADDVGEVTMAQVVADKKSALAQAEAKRTATRTGEQPAVQAKIDRSIFRAYDIRGVLGETLDAGVAKLIGRAIGSELRDRGLRELAVGRDGRLSGPALQQALMEGLLEAGCDVVDVGMAPTPLVYFGSFQLNTGSCVAVTGSHNPPDYNGFKIVLGGETLSGDGIQDLYARIAENRLRSDGGGSLRAQDISREYIERISSDIQLERRMRVVIDCGNGVAGAIAPDVLDAIGCEAELLYCDVDGNFPNHHPDPSEPENLRDLVTAVTRTGAELGLAFDGDGDRLGVVTRNGEMIYPDRLLMLFAQDVLSRNPGAAVIYDVKCTGHLAGQILRHGGSPIMWKTGHSLIKAKMKETEAELAGEMSGHFFFRERWYGFDDGIYAAARLLEILAADERSPEEIFAELPKGFSTPELKIKMKEGEHYAFIDKFREKARFEGAKIVTIDGIRADWPDGWGLVRCSNTTPSLVLRFDADNGDALARIQHSFRSQLLALRPDLELPF